MMARELKLSRKMIAEIGHFASLHDVGKSPYPIVFCVNKAR